MLSCTTHAFRLYQKAEEQAKQNAAGPSSGASSAQQPSSKSAKPSKQQQQPQAAPAAVSTATEAHVSGDRGQKGVQHTKIVQQEVRDANEADTSRSTTVAAATTNKGEDGVTPTSKSAGSSDRM
jgi:hypothetical protein